MITQRAISRSDRRDYALLVRAGRANQLSFDMLTVWDHLGEALARLANGAIVVEPNAYGAVWRFDSSVEMDDIRDVVQGIVITDDWLLRTDDRIEYAGWKKHEIAALVQAWRRAS